MKSKALVSLLAIGLFIAAPAFAHRVGIPTTTIEWNERTSKWELIHVLSAHDYSKVVSPETALNSEDAVRLEAELNEYVLSHFQLLGIYQINFVGAELEADDLFIYYEFWAPDQMLLVHNSLLIEVDTTGMALVNKISGDDIETMIFDDGGSWQPMRLYRPT